MIKCLLSLKKANEEIIRLKREKAEIIKVLADLSIRHKWTLEMPCVCRSHIEADQIIKKEDNNG